MSDNPAADDIVPVEVFSGTAWEVALVETLLENAEIPVYIYYGGESTMAPWDSGGGMPINRVLVSSSDYDRAQQVVGQYYEALRNQTPEP